ncbi:transcriptional regulator, HxlR family [Lentzea xinjiangensis]|uniref:Transcriptional regulator, HxlR family n=1 Tax=Lentzea xinjiangensis TaxID=402600 RepID=A0A1H9PDQ3_9PSEU|nr:helix-turn-helix domain-containing protein [Lentzea xinjiangensis]SER46308.1 transcriptional regulator, HxlR family [Lentzea xinjiangensis]
MTADSSRVEHERVEEVLDVVIRRWSGTILRAGDRGARRFGEYRLAVEGISDRVLSRRLKELEAAGLLSREVIASTPVQILYRPTPAGRELLDAMEPLFRWCERRAGGQDRG